MTQEKIDFVVLWVDDSDPEWQKERAETAKKFKLDGFDEVRFRDWDLFHYWFRGVEKFAPWVNKVHLVTWGHLPSWLNVDHPKLNIVKHSDYIPEEYLPTFSSNTIELNLHRLDELEEHFVCFNDDTYLTSPTKPTTFFKKGLPAATAVHIPWRMLKNEWFVTPGINVAIINEHFKAHGAIMKHLPKWLSPRYGRFLFATLAMMPHPNFYGFYEWHLPNSFLKSTFAKVWEAEEKILDATSRESFRSPYDVNQWLMENWQFCEGNFVPRSPKFGINFHLHDYTDAQLKEVCDAIVSGKYKVVGVNDGYMPPDKLERAKAAVRNAFEQILPEKSSFEI